MIEHGQVALIRKVQASAADALHAAAVASDDRNVALPIPPGSVAEQIEDLEAGIGPSPTPSVEIKMVFSDHSAQRVWVQTGIIERTTKEGNAFGETVLVLETREFTARDDGSLGRIYAQVDVSQILAVEQLGPADLAAGMGADVSFVVAARRGADLLGVPLGTDIDEEDDQDKARGRRPSAIRRAKLGIPDPEEKRDEGGPEPSPFHPGMGDSMLVCFIAGPSAWRRREAPFL